MIPCDAALAREGSGRLFQMRSAEVLVVGSGVAGLSAALELSRISTGCRILLLTRDGFGGHGASPLAQGGIAAALDPGDSPSLHAEDTLLAANGLARRELVEILTEEGPDRIQQLLELGTRFDLDASGQVSLGLESAHSHPRIVHADGDRTGVELTRALCAALRHTGSIDIIEHTQALKLFSLDGEVRGLWGLHADGTLRLFRAAATILATGGAGRVYLHTTSPPGLDGDGITMSARAGALLRDLEFVQFHPTALNVRTDPLPLITEALRGAGALLVDRAGDRIMATHEGDELAPRDRVARATWLRLKEGSEVFLDARDVLADSSGALFPGVRQLCARYSIDPARELIPVTPAAHYHMGGVAVDAEGRTSLGGLWAVGEAAASGVHGANRLASNSLLEGIVFGPRAARSVTSELRALDEPSEGEIRYATQNAPVPGPALPEASVLQIRTTMWNRVGVVRSSDGLATATKEFDEISQQLPASIPEHARNLLLSAQMITQAAHLRRESVGGHFRSDASPAGNEPLLHSVVSLTEDGDGSPQVVAAFEQVTPISVGKTPVEND
jgi:L-aspartate oxidase